MGNNLWVRTRVNDPDLDHVDWVELYASIDAPQAAACSFWLDDLRFGPDPAHPVPLPLEDADRAVARWVLRWNGAVRIWESGKEYDVSGGSALPEAPFKVVQIILQGSSVTDEVVRGIEGATDCRMVDLSDARITDAGLESLRRMVHLERLTLVRVKGVSGSGFASLKDLQKLRLLDFTYGGGTDEGAEGLGQLAHLEEARLASLAITARGLKYLEGLKQLRTLMLGSVAGVNDEGMPSIGRLTGLRVLHLAQAPITDKGLKSLAGLTELGHLDIRSSHVTDDGLAALKPLAHLAFLAISCDDKWFHGRGLAHLKGSLGAVEIERYPAGRVEDSLLEALEGLPNLQYVGFMQGIVFTEAQFRMIARCRSVVGLLFGYSKIPEPWFTHLRAMPKLESVGLNVVDLGTQPFTGLKTLENVKRMSIACEGLKPAMMAELVEALPHCQVDLGGTPGIQQAVDALRKKK